MELALRKSRNCAGGTPKILRNMVYSKDYTIKISQSENYADEKGDFKARIRGESRTRSGNEKKGACRLYKSRGGGARCKIRPKQRGRINPRVRTGVSE